jgi:twitching motility protein PilI
MEAGQSAAHERWLSPSAALNRFNRRQDAHAGAILEAEDQVSYGFRVGDIGLLISTSTTSEVFEPLPASALPNTVDGFVGLCNLRGNIIPVYKIETLFHTQENSAEARKLLVLGKNNFALGILISGLPQALQFNDTHIMSELPPIPGWFAEYVPRAYLKDERVWLDFDHDRFFYAIAEGLVGFPKS